MLVLKRIVGFSVPLPIIGSMGLEADSNGTGLPDWSETIRVKRVSPHTTD